MQEVFESSDYTIFAWGMVNEWINYILMIVRLFRNPRCRNQRNEINRPNVVLTFVLVRFDLTKTNQEFLLTDERVDPVIGMVGWFK